ncbi:extracellular solute-binding protein [Paenibacillus sp. J5C_2022]|uniref:extracellular solute-binding protein n=1 Tax=Paenibacillus sp. J5C2022 TaxID=2977129 RepID=UPI0021CF7FD5|nr:extracellular solute-binding protein [Paenibacillus sp. J5C2022]MCU6712818.1 extracellular solute-binding protein [Paenibacillus sp. J5C2022]
MQNKKRLVLLLALSLSLTAAACSNSNEPVPTSQPAPQNDSGQKQAEETNTPEKPVDISYLSFAYNIFPDPGGNGVDMIREKFNANIDSQFVQASDFNNKLSVLMASGDMPDTVFITGSSNNYVKWARQGAFLPLNDYIDDYETFRLVPDVVWDQIAVDGNIYSIPGYAPTYTFSGIIRQDWLDQLQLDMPTNYEELKQVAIAFAKNDPDNNGEDDTYGIALGMNIRPDYAMGAFWSTAWYHKDEEGQYIPGIISPGRKEVIQTLAEAYAEGGVTKDFAVLNSSQTAKEFFSGKAGIYIGVPHGMNESEFVAFKQTHPQAEVAPIPFFVAPDGSQGGYKAPGYVGLTTLSGKLKDNPEKVKKILEIVDYGRTFIPIEERTADNERFDWLFGGEGIGYDMEDGKAVLKSGEESNTPIQYMLARHEYWKPWAPNNEANQFAKTLYTDPDMRKLATAIEEMELQYNKTPYDNPVLGIFSETAATKGGEIDKFIIGEQIKMIAGQRPLSDWDDIVEEWKARGGTQIIQEMNDGIQARQAAK